ncbi:MAG: hypothetical protein Q4G63_11560 [Bacteroidia bacterium]|nr:hypothetical protein [Bacteroidia bacterium]
MKKVLISAIILLCMGTTQNVSAQKENLKDVESISFYGIDFSYAKVYGADESAEKFIDVFARINDLFESEPKKYNAGKAFGIMNTELFNSQMRKEAGKVSTRNLFIEENKYSITDTEINQVVSKLDKQGESKYGAVVICGLLNKLANYGTFTFIVFEQGTNKVIFQKEVAGKAKGFGLRNFWAGALFDAMKKLK